MALIANRSRQWQDAVRCAAEIRMEKHALFPVMIHRIDEALGKHMRQLNLKYRNDGEFRRLCDAANLIHDELTRDPQRMVIGAELALRSAIERFEAHYRDRIRAAGDQAFAEWLDEHFAESVPASYDDSEPRDVEFEQEGDGYNLPFDERFHLPASAIEALLVRCLNLSSFDVEEDPDAHQELELANGAFDFIQQVLGIDLDEAVRRRRGLAAYFVDRALRTDNTGHWRKLEAYLHQALTAHVLGHDLAAIALARPIAEHVIRTSYVPALCPDLDAEQESSLTRLVRRVQDTPGGSWIKSMNGERVIDGASKILHFRDIDDFNRPESLALLARDTLKFVRHLLLKAPG